MKYKYARTITAAAAVLALSGAGLGITAAASASTGGFNSATIQVTNHDDSGTNSNGTTNNWALDAYGASVHIAAGGVVANSFCPGIPVGACHKFTGTITDAGTFTTVVGDAVPGQGSLNGGAAPLIGTQVSGPFRGTLQYLFYANVPLTSFSNGNSPNLSGVSGDSPSTEQWPIQFLPASAHVWDTSGNEDANASLGSGPFSFTYTAALGSDPACPHVSGQWVDSSAGNDGASAVDGNILAPAASDC